VFASPQSMGKTVLIFDVNPFIIGADSQPVGVYSINGDNDGDALADAAVTFAFSESNGGAQSRSCRLDPAQLSKAAKVRGH